MTASQGAATARRGWSITVLLLGVFVSSLDLFIVNIAFPDLALSFPSSTLSSLSWVLSAYAITFAAFLAPHGPVGGPVRPQAGLPGGSRAVHAGLARLRRGPVAGCARGGPRAPGDRRSPDAAELARSAAPAVPAGTARSRGRPVVGDGRGGRRAGAADRRTPRTGRLRQWVFIVNLPIGVAAVAVGAWALREIREESSTSPDVLGAVALAVTVGALVAAIVQGETWGWTSGRVLGLFALGLLGAAFSAVRAVRHPAPVIEPAILRIRAVALANLATILFFAGFGAMILGSVLFLTDLWDHSVLRAGLEIAPGPIMAAVCAVPGVCWPPGTATTWWASRAVSSSPWAASCGRPPRPRTRPT